MRKILTLFIALSATVAALAIPGTGPANYAQPSRDLNQVIITESGQITLSSDGLGMTGTSGLIQADKPSAGATVRAAFLATASTGFGGYIISDNEITLAGSGVAWDIVVASGISSYNHWSNVTAIVAPILNAAGAGISDLELIEPNSGAVDGHALYVIFDDPTTTITRTAVIAFGAQATSGDQFAIGFGQPVEVDANTVIEMGLAISFGYARGTCQTSYIDVNGQRFTSSAGGNDDGEDADGALVTVGGIGDSRVNPADAMYNDPCQFEDFTDYDDELYDIAGRVSTGDTGILVTTFNPSGDDNIFVAHLLLDFEAVVGEGAVLTPSQAVNCLGDPHTVTVTLQDDNGQPVVGRDVVIDVVTGPNIGLSSGLLTSNNNGQAIFTYTSMVEGTDALLATFANSAGEPQNSNHAFKTWERCDVNANELPANFALNQNVPNPFNPTTTIAFTMPEAGVATLMVHDLTGRTMATLVNGMLERGRHSVTFDGGKLPSGVYFYTLQVDNLVETRKMVLMK